MILPKAPVERLIRSSGAERVADNASVELSQILERVGYKISEQAKRYAQHAGRKTIVAEDIKLAADEIVKGV
ncbi:MAG: histone family protein [Candidatus Micrarchaeia archaeon]